MIDNNASIYATSHRDFLPLIHSVILDVLRWTMTIWLMSLVLEMCVWRPTMEQIFFLIKFRNTNLFFLIEFIVSKFEWKAKSRWYEKSMKGEGLYRTHEGYFWYFKTKVRCFCLSSLNCGYFCLSPYKVSLFALGTWV